VRRLAGHFTAEAYDVLFLNVGTNVKPAVLSLPLLSDSMLVVPIVHADYAWTYTTARLNADAWNCAVAISPKVRQMLVAQTPDKPVVLIPNGVVLPGDAELRSRAAWKTPIRLLFVGRLDKLKGIVLLPAILAACLKMGVPARLTVIGDGQDSAALDQAISETGMRELVDLWGAKSLPDVYAAMRTHHILLLPSGAEGFGLVLAEAQANGCVPVASQLPGVTDFVVEDGVTGLLVEPGNVEKFARQVAMLMEPMRWLAFSRAGMARARALFSAEAMGVRYIALLEDIRRGKYPLAQSRAVLRRRWQTPFMWRDRLPSGIRRPLGRLRRQIATGANFGPLRHLFRQHGVAGQ
jgi:glycosyltransferase involved in cell wall biosynthesis